MYRRQYWFYVRKPSREIRGKPRHRLHCPRFYREFQPWVLGGIVVGCGLIISACGVAPPPGARNVAPWHTAHSRATLSVVPRFYQGHVYWRLSPGPWHQTPWNTPSTAMPRPLRQSLQWITELHAGIWPGSPVPAIWAQWAGHVGAPLGWQLWPQPPGPHGRPVVSLAIFFPERAPYHGIAKLTTWWTENAQHQWVAQHVNSPTVLPVGLSLTTIWHKSTSATYLRHAVPVESGS